MKTQRLLTLVLGGVTLAGSAGYLFVYLYRWEWNRAIIAGVVFLAAEIGVVGWSLHGRLAEVERRQRTQADLDRRRRIAGHLDTARAEPSRPFAWLEGDGGRLGVFIPILLGAGLVLSSLAWVVERLSRATVGRGVDDHLADSLCRLGVPPGGFLDDRDEPLRLLHGPTGGAP
jgi:hypothetical protein